jgi:putative membrane protein
MSPISDLRTVCPVATRAALAVVLAVGACRGGGEQYADTATGAVGSPGAPAAPATSTALADPQIAHVAVTANSIDSAAGEFALTRAQNARVKEFAQRMIQDHGSVNKRAAALAQRLNLRPAENDISRQLQQGDQQARDSLAGKRGADFDRAYIDREVQYHQAVLDALDKTLIPGAQNAELKTLLQEVRPNVAAHLQMAQQIQGSLGRR